MMNKDNLKNSFQNHVLKVKATHTLFGGAHETNKTYTTKDKGCYHAGIHGSGPPPVRKEAGDGG